MSNTSTVLQLAILILTLAIVFTIYYNLHSQSQTKLRTRATTRTTTTQSKRHFIHGAQLLTRARSTRTKSHAKTLAKYAADEADEAISFNPRDGAAHVLKALALDLMGHKSSALKCLDSALSAPAVKCLSERERGDALFKRAELQLAVNRRRRVDSATDDLVEAVRLGCTSSSAYCLLGECYGLKGMREEAREAFLEALKMDSGLLVARDGLVRLGL